MSFVSVCFLLNTTAAPFRTHGIEKIVVNDDNCDEEIKQHRYIFKDCSAVTIVHNYCMISDDISTILLHGGELWLNMEYFIMV